MCGITGIFRHLHWLKIFWKIWLKSRYRGPDGNDIFVDGNIGLGHTRPKS